MKQPIPLYVIAVVIGVAVGMPGAFASTPESTIAERIQAVLLQRFPDIKIRSVAPTPMSGVYEVLSDADPVYTDATGDFLIVGSMIDTRSMTNLTQQRIALLDRVDFSALPVDLAVKDVRGDGSRKVAVFADPMCPYCRKLEEELRGLDNLTVYTFILPAMQPHPTAGDLTARIWCSTDRTSAWRRWMLERETPTSEVCADEPSGRIKELGDRLRVSGTPTMFFPDGSRLAGVPPGVAFDGELMRRQRVLPGGSTLTGNSGE